MSKPIKRMKTQAFNGTEVSVGRIVSMLQALEPDDVAAALGMPWADIKAMLTRANALPRARWAGKCLKTGRVIRSYTERGVYLKAQIAGWGALGADWCFIDPRDAGSDTA